jgi:hypothetical protein
MVAVFAGAERSSARRVRRRERSFTALGRERTAGPDTNDLAPGVFICKLVDISPARHALMRLGTVVALLALARLAVAQATDTTGRAAGVVVSGTVRDSIARTPLAGAIVQLVARDGRSLDARTTVSDARGEFAFDRVSPGRYAIGFFHPMLDSLGLESAARELTVDGRRVVRADLAIPPPARLRAAICGPKPSSASDALVLGFVHDARDGTPVAGATVTGEWLEIAIARGKLGSRVPRLVATTSDRGWFALCDVPSPGTILLTARRGADSTDVLELSVPANGLLRRELYVGSARMVTGVDTAMNATHPVRAGDGHLSGVVLATVDGRPVAGAVVAMAEGPETRTNELGEWTLTDAPAGSRMLEVRALGYYPERRAVDVLDGAAPVRVSLSTMRAVLDTVKVKATRLSDRQQAEFDQRRRSGFGRYLTAEEIAQRRPAYTSELFRALPGVRFDRTNVNGELGTPSITMRAGVGGYCQPAIYVDGHYLFELTADELDAFVQPSEIVGIEVYSGATAPPQFQAGLNGCGSIVIWTNIDSADRPKMTKARAITAVVAVTLGLLATALLFRH